MDFQLSMCPHPWFENQSATGAQKRAIIVNGALLVPSKRVDAFKGAVCLTERGMKQITRLSLLVALVAAGAVLAGCAQRHERQAVLVGTPAPMTTEEVAIGANAGESESALISQLQQRGYDGTLTTEDVDQLRTDGVPEPVIDWMLAHPGSVPLLSARVSEVVYVERPARAHSTVGVSFGSGSSRRHHARRRDDKRDRDDEDDSSRTRTIQGKNGRVYRFTSGK